jgi:hypothetical protein
LHLKGEFPETNVLGHKAATFETGGHPPRTLATIVNFGLLTPGPINVMVKESSARDA